MADIIYLKPEHNPINQLDAVEAAIRDAEAKLDQYTADLAEALRVKQKAVDIVNRANDIMGEQAASLSRLRRLKMILEEENGTAG